MNLKKKGIAALVILGVIALLTITLQLEPTYPSVNTNKELNHRSTLLMNPEQSAGQFLFYPSGPEFIRGIIDQRGNVEITDEMREGFNRFARDYRFTYIPDMNYYESFFEANQYAESFGYDNFGFAAFYVLQYLKSPEKISADVMQNAIESLFVAEGSYQPMTHQEFRKLAKYENGYYSPWPDGGLDHDKMFYLLTGLNITQEGSDDLYITLRSKSYYFEHPAFAPGENEKWLAKKAEELGVADLQAAADLIASGEIAQNLEGGHEYETKIHVNLREQNYNPRFVSSHSRYIETDYVPRSDLKTVNDSAEAKELLAYFNEKFPDSPFVDSLFADVDNDGHNELLLALNTYSGLNKASLEDAEKDGFGILYVGIVFPKGQAPTESVVVLGKTVEQGMFFTGSNLFRVVKNGDRIDEVKIKMVNPDGKEDYFPFQLSIGEDGIRRAKVFN